MDDHPIASSPSNEGNSSKSTADHIEWLEKKIEGLQVGASRLMQENAHLNYQLNWFCRKERDLESTLVKIKAEAEEVFVGDNEIFINTQAAQGPQRNTHDEITSILTNLLQENTRLNERVRRHTEVLEQANREASTSVAHYEEVIADLMTKLNTLQSRKETLYDDQCVTEWRNLRQALDAWTRRNFKDKEALNKMTSKSLRENNLPAVPPEEVLKAIHAKRAYIQSVIAAILSEEVFQPTFARIPTQRTVRFVNNLSKTVKKSVNSHVWEYWRSATSKGLEKFAPYRLNESYDTLVEKIHLLCKCYGPNVQMDTAYEALEKIFDDCVAFKTKLERQESDYKFQQSQQGTVYYPEKMNSLNAEDDDGSTVQISVWPSIYKVSFDGEKLLLEPEAVWTRSLDDMDDVDMLKQFGIKKEPEEAGE